MVGIHDARHHLPIHGQRHVDLLVPHHGRPVLVAEGVTEFDGALQLLLVRPGIEPPEVDNQHVVQADIDHDGPVPIGIVGQNIAVEHPRIALQGHGIVAATVATGHETALLRRPLIQFDPFDIRTAQRLGPVGHEDVADHFGIDFRLSLHNSVSFN